MLLKNLLKSKKSSFSSLFPRHHEEIGTFCLESKFFFLYLARTLATAFPSQAPSTNGDIYGKYR